MGAGYSMTTSEPMNESRAAAIGSAINALWEPQALANPYPAYERVRALSENGVLEAQFPDWKALFLTGHAACSAVLRSPHALSGNGIQNMGGEGSEGVRLLQSMMLFHNGMSHQRLRGLVSSAFTPRVVEEQRELVRSLLDTLLDDIAARGGGDIVADLSNPLPARVIMGMLGLRGEGIVHAADGRMLDSVSTVWFQGDLPLAGGRFRPVHGVDLSSGEVELYADVAFNGFLFFGVGRGVFHGAHLARRDDDAHTLYYDYLTLFVLAVSTPDQALAADLAHSALAPVWTATALVTGRTWLAPGPAMWAAATR